MKDITLKYNGGEIALPLSEIWTVSQDGENVKINRNFSSLSTIVIPGRAQDIFDQLAAAYGGVTRRWRVYGENGDSQRESLSPSAWYNFSEPGEIRLIQVLNSDVTGTNEYTEVVVTRNTIDLCDEEMEGQITDGIFENCRVGKVIEIEE